MADRLALMLKVLRSYVDGALMTPEQHELWMRSQDPDDPVAQKLEHVLRTGAVRARVKLERELAEAEARDAPQQAVRRAEAEARAVAWREQMRLERERGRVERAEQEHREQRVKRPPAKRVRPRGLLGSGGPSREPERERAAEENWAVALYEEGGGGEPRELNFDHA